jgi:hypothetical protein
MSTGVEIAGLPSNSASRSRLMTERDRLLFAPLPSLHLRAVETESEIKTYGEEYRSAGPETALIS